jgi:hypothetical protein
VVCGRDEKYKEDEKYTKKTFLSYRRIPKIGCAK